LLLLLLIVNAVVVVVVVVDDDGVCICCVVRFFPKELSSVGDVVGQIQAQDNDQGENAGILYDIAGGDQNGEFFFSCS
jgi:hypothetical protein